MESVEDSRRSSSAAAAAAAAAESDEAIYVARREPEKHRSKHNFIFKSAFQTAMINSLVFPQVRIEFKPQALSQTYSRMQIAK